MMGDTRVTKRFTSICDEGELRVQEEMSLIKKLDVLSESKEKIPPVQRDRSYSRKGYVVVHIGGDDDIITIIKKIQDS